MISWTDVGIVLATQKHGEKYKIASIFTKEHGKITAMAYNTKLQTYANFSLVKISYNSHDTNSLGFWKLLSEETIWISIYKSENHLIVYQSICFILNKLLPQNASHLRLYELTEYVLSNFKQFDKQQILFIYAYFELTMLKHLGFSLNLDYTEDVTNFDDVIGIVSSNQFQSDICRLLCLSSKIMEKHLVKVDNFFRTSIINKTMSYMKDKEEI